jgi:hypothetical protein
MTAALLSTYIAYSGADAWLAYLKGMVFARFSVYDLSVIPLFLLMGQLASQGGLSRALVRAAAAFVGHWRGGLAQSAILASAAFGSVCGSSVATAATIAQVALPEMRRFRYDGGFATATLAAGGTLGILIPPSIVLVLYAIIAEQNIAPCGRAVARIACSGSVAGHRARDVAASRTRSSRAARRMARALGAAGGRATGAGHLPDRAGRHLWRRVHRDRGRRDRRPADCSRRCNAT